MDETPHQLDVDFNEVTRRALDGTQLLHRESARGCVLVGGAVLDEILGALLRAFLIRDEGVGDALLTSPNAPLATFSSRIRACRGLGIVSDPLYRDLERIRNIRNEAAHFDRRGDRGLDFSFESPSVGDRCRALVTIPDDFRRDFSPRVLFEAFVGLVSSYLSGTAQAARWISDNVGHVVAQRSLLDVAPKRDFSPLFVSLADRLRSEHPVEGVVCKPTP
jgi:hypothetical protein